MPRKLTILLPLVVLFAAGCSPTASDVSHPIISSPPIPTPTPTPMPDQITTSTSATTSTGQSFVFTKKTIKEDGKTISFDIEYPQMEQATDTEMQKAFNGIVFEKNIRDQVAQMRTDNMNAVKEGMMTSAAWSLDLSGGVTYQSPRLINVFLSGSQDTGGAHPNAYYENVYFDPTLKRELHFSELFENATTSLQQLSAWSREELNKQNEISDYTDPKWLATGTEADETNFQFSHMTDNGLVIAFPPYQVAAYVAGEQDVVIAWEKINPLLKPEYRKE